VAVVAVVLLVDEGVELFNRMALRWGKGISNEHSTSEGGVCSK
jgi:hypothetical protein